MKLKVTNIIFLIAFTFFSCSKDDSVPEYIKKGSYDGLYFPTSEWRECSPEEVGMNSSKLNAVYDFCANENINTFSYLIIKDGYIVSEKYFGNNQASTKIQSYSLAKSFTAALTGIAIQKGYIASVDDSIVNYFPQLQNESIQQEKKEVTIKQLLTMTSGFQWSEDEISYTSNDLMNVMLENNYVNYVLNKPIVNTPGTMWNYSSGMPLLLGGIIENTTGMNTFSFAKQTLFHDIGINDVSWDSDSEGHTSGAWGLYLNTRDYAKLGFLYWQNGIWDDKQILPEYWVTDTRKPALEDAQHYGYLFWRAYRYASQVGTKVPEDTYMATGLMQKYIIIIPSYNLILVRLGEDLSEGENGWSTAEFISLVIAAVDNQ